MDAMECDCARSLIEALTGSSADEIRPAPTDPSAPAGTCLWCGAPPRASLVSGR
jgi:hypothetical protein